MRFYAPEEKGKLKLKQRGGMPGHPMEVENTDLGCHYNTDTVFLNF